MILMMLSTNNTEELGLVCTLSPLTLKARSCLYLSSIPAPTQYQFVAQDKPMFKKVVEQMHPETSLDEKTNTK